MPVLLHSLLRAVLLRRVSTPRQPVGQFSLEIVTGNLTGASPACRFAVRPGWQFLTLHILQSGFLMTSSEKFALFARSISGF